MTAPSFFSKGPRALSHIADFAEWECLLCEDGGVSMHHICRVLVRDEEFHDDSGEDAEENFGESPKEPDSPDAADRQWEDQSRQRAREDAMRQRVWESFDEARTRKEHCGGVFYPFELTQRGAILRKRRAANARQKWEARLYLFLLLATLESDDQAAALFERLCLSVAQNYWGGDARVRTFFIADRSASFKSKVDNLAKELGEGGGFDRVMGTGNHRGDGGMDIAVFRRFADNRAGQLIGFGQCKTGRSYWDALAQSSPGNYVNKWFKEKRLLVNPVGLFFVSDRIADAAEWRKALIDSESVFFDRCRVMEYADKARKELREAITAWTRARWKEIGGGPFPF